MTPWELRTSTTHRPLVYLWWRIDGTLFLTTSPPSQEKVDKNQRETVPPSLFVRELHPSTVGRSFEMCRHLLESPPVSSILRPVVVIEDTTTYCACTNLYSKRKNLDYVSLFSKYRFTLPLSPFSLIRSTTHHNFVPYLNGRRWE